MNGQIQRTLCSHGHPPMRCETEGCTNRDSRSLLEQLFSRQPNSVTAARVYRESPQVYAELREEAQRRGMMAFGAVPAALRD
jgi:hypothetical protein